jgi:hypothetical protein
MELVLANRGWSLFVPWIAFRYDVVPGGLDEVVTPGFIDCMCVESSLSPKRRVNRLDFFRPHCCCRWKQVAVFDAVS